METIKKWKCTCGKKAEEFSFCDECEAKNKLTAFLEGEKGNVPRYIGEPIEDWVENHDTRLMNFVLDIVGEEVEKKISFYEEMMQKAKDKKRLSAWSDFSSKKQSLYHIKQILTNLKK